MGLGKIACHRTQSGESELASGGCRISRQRILECCARLVPLSSREKRIAYPRLEFCLHFAGAGLFRLGFGEDLRELRAFAQDRDQLRVYQRLVEAGGGSLPQLDLGCREIAGLSQRYPQQVARFTRFRVLLEHGLELDGGSNIVALVEVSFACRNIPGRGSRPATEQQGRSECGQCRAEMCRAHRWSRSVWGAFNPAYVRSPQAKGVPDLLHAGGRDSVSCALSGVAWREPRHTDLLDLRNSTACRVSLASNSFGDW